MPRQRVVGLLVFVLAAVVVLSLSGADPAALGLLLDVDFLAVTGLVGLGLLRTDLRLLALRCGRSLPALWVRVGCQLTRHRPRSLLAP